MQRARNPRRNVFCVCLLYTSYFVIKWAVKNGIKEAYSAITGKKTDEDIQNEKELKELGLDSEDQ